MTTRTWVTREEWAAERRTPNPPQPRMPAHVSAYVAPEEVAAEIDRLRAVWRELGRDARRVETPLDMHRKTLDKRERCRQFYHVDDTWTEYDTIIERRRQVNAAIRHLGHDRMPPPSQQCGAEEIAASFRERYDAAHDAAYAAACAAEVEVNAARAALVPTDDAAWADELASREEIEAGLFIVDATDHQRRVARYLRDMEPTVDGARETLEGAR